MYVHIYNIAPMLKCAVQSVYPNSQVSIHFLHFSVMDKVKTHKKKKKNGAQN